MCACYAREPLTRREVWEIIFQLQNNYGYSERQQIDCSPTSAAAASAEAYRWTKSGNCWRRLPGNGAESKV